ncbi:MAG: hypothetical protein R3B89_33055 [Polyangiaceae bacterium]
MAAAEVEAYRELREQGAVLDVLRFPHGTPAQELVLEAMTHLVVRYDVRLRALNQGVIPEGVFRLKIHEEKLPLVPTPITFQELWGSGYDVAADRVEIFRYSSGSCATIAKEGLARALLNPPYGLRKHISAPFGSPEYAEKDRAWMRDFVHRFCAVVLELDDLRETAHLKIHEWATDWSNYFDAGREWWGTYCWTIEDPKRQWTTALLASASD